MKTKKEFPLSADITAFVEKTSDGTPCLLVVRSEKLDDYDTYKPQGGEWELSYDSLSQRRYELDEEASELVDTLWDNAEFAQWANALCPQSQKIEITTDHPASSYGQPVCLIDGQLVDATDAIEACRKTLGWTREQMAKACGRDINTIDAYRYGKLPVVPAEVWNVLRDALDRLS